MRVLHCITGLTGDGAQRMLLRLVAGLNAHGVYSHVVNLGAATAVANYFQQAGIPVHSLNLSASPASAVRGVRQIRALLDTLSPDLLQGWMYHANLLLTSAHAASARKFPVLWNIRRGLDDLAERSFKTRCVVRAGAFFSWKATRIIYCSRESRVQHEEFGYSRGRSHVLENGFDTERFAPSAVRRDTFRNLHHLSPDDFVIGKVARFDVAKGHTYLLDAFTLVAQALPKAKLVLLGRGMDRNNRTIVEAINSAGLHSRVLMLGEAESIENVYPGFDLYCSASLNEGFPNAISEAMACGIPCVVTDTGASRQLVEDAGIVVRSRDSRALAEAIIAMYHKSPAERQQIGEGLRQRIETQFGLKQIVSAYHSLYEEMVMHS